MRRRLWQHPFLTLGLATLLLFFVVERLREHGATEALLLTILYVATWGAGAPSFLLGVVWASLQFIAGLVPYAALDHLLQRWRNRKAQRHLAA